MNDVAVFGFDVDGRPLRGGADDLRKFGNAGVTTGQQLTGMAATAKKSFGVVALAAGTALAAIASFGSGVRTIREFDSSISRLGAITGATTTELSAMRDVAKGLGSTTEFSARQAADGLTFLGMAGFNASESIAAIPAVLDLATASGLGLAEAADTASNIMSGFGIEAENAAAVSDVLAAASSRANTDVSQLGQAMSTVAPIASALGIDLADTASAIGVLSDAGIQGSRAGTALRGVMAALAGPTTEAEKALRDLGLTAADVNPETQSLASVMGKLETAGLSTAQAMTIFGREAASGALVLVDGNERLAAFGDELRDVDGAASDMAETMRDNLGGDIDGLMSSVSGLMLALGEAGLTTIIRGVVQALTGITRVITSLVNVIGGAIGLFQDAGRAILGMGSSSQEMQRAIDTANLAIADEVTQLASLAGALAPGTQMSRDMAEAKLSEAESRFQNIEAMRAEALEAVRASEEYQGLTRTISDLQEEIRNTQAAGAIDFAPNANREGMEVALDLLRQSVAEQKSLLAATSATSPEYIEAKERVAELRAALAEATGETVVLGDEVGAAADTTEALARLAGEINFDTATASAAQLAAQLQISLATASAIANMSATAREGVSGPDAAIASLQNEGRLGGGPLQEVVFQRTFPATRVAAGGGSRGGGSSGGGGGSRGGKSEAQREAEQQRNKDLRERDRILDSLKTSQDEYNDALAQATRLEQAGILSLETYNEHVAQLGQEFAEAQWRDSGLDIVANDMARAIATAGSLGDAFDNLGDVFRNTLQNMAQNLIQSGINSLMQQAFGGFLGGGFGAPAGGPASAIVMGLAGARADGGPVSSGQTYLVGERGPELFTPSVSGGITPNHQMGGGGTITMNMTVDPSVIVSISENTTGMALQQNNKAADAGFNQRSSSWANDRRRRGAQ